MGWGVGWTLSLADLQHLAILKVAKQRSVEWEGGCKGRMNSCQIPLIYTVGFCCVGRLSALLFQFPVLFAFTPICAAENHLNLSKLRDTFQISYSDYHRVVLHPNISSNTNYKNNYPCGSQSSQFICPFISTECMAYFQPIHKNGLFMFVVLKAEVLSTKLISIPALTPTQKC